MSTPRPTEADVEALAKVLLRHGHAEWIAFDARVVADAVLRSDWLAARDAEHQREVEALRAEVDKWRRATHDTRTWATVLVDRNAAIKAALAEWDKAPSILSGADEWTKGWLRCLEQAATEIRALLPTEDDQ